jgi:hypothetical protein
MVVVRIFGIACMILTVAITTLDSATTGRFGSMTVGEFVSTVDFEAMAALRHVFANDAELAQIGEFFFKMPAALSFVVLGVACLWFAHRRDRASEATWVPGV